MHLDFWNRIYIQALWSQYLGPFIWVPGWWVPALRTRSFQTWEFGSQYLGPSIWVPSFGSRVPGTHWELLLPFSAQFLYIPILSSTGESENTNSNLKKKPPQQSNNDLEVCFINEYSTADSTSSSSVLDNSNNGTHALSRSKSEYVSISSCFNQLELDPSLVNVTSSSSSQTSSLLEYTQKLANCKDIARRKIFIEKRNRKFHHINTLNKLIGKSIEIKLSSDILSQMNTPTIQVIVNDFHSKIENLNEELVNELMQKDELQVSK